MRDVDKGSCHKVELLEPWDIAEVVGGDCGTKFREGFQEGLYLGQGEEEARHKACQSEKVQNLLKCKSNLYVVTLSFKYIFKCRTRPTDSCLE